MKCFYYFAFLLTTFSAQAYAQIEIPNSLEVEGSAWTHVGPDLYRAQITIEERDVSAVSCRKKLKDIELSFEKFGEEEDVSLVIVSRGLKVSFDATGSQAFFCSHPLSIGASDLDALLAVMDLAKEQGAKVDELQAYIRNAEEAKREAGLRALSAALEKAEAISQEFSIPLGSVLSAIVTEEPTGSFIAQQRQRGQDPLAFANRDIKVVARIRFHLSDVNGEPASE